MLNPRAIAPLPSVRLRRPVRPGLRLPVWALLAMAVAMLLRVVSGLPVVQTPHSHGGVQHTHGAGGLAHNHDHGDADGHPVLAAGSTPHRHGDGPLHVDLPDGTALVQTAPVAQPRRAVKTNDYPVFIPVRWPPEHLVKAKPEPKPLPAPRHPHRDAHRDDYFCAAASIALASSVCDIPWPLEQAREVATHYGAPFLEHLPTPRQTRGPPRSA